MKILAMVGRRATGLMICSLVAAAGCSSGSGGGGGGGGSYASRRSPTCLEFQTAFCDYLADRCAVGTRAECEDTARSLFCKSDAIMQPCIDALPTATCGETPTACQNVADPAPAIEFCNELLSRFCDRMIQCEAGMTKQDCLAQVGMSIDCSTALGVGPTGDQCLGEIGGTACPLDALPESCQGVVKVNQ